MDMRNTTTQQMRNNMNRAAREVSRSDSIYTETIWQGLSQDEQRSLRTSLESVGITSRIGQHLDREVYFLAVSIEDRRKAVDVMHRLTLG